MGTPRSIVRPSLSETPERRLRTLQGLSPESFEVVMVANMCHISPWESTLGLCRGASPYLSHFDRVRGKLSVTFRHSCMKVGEMYAGAAKVLSPGGLLMIYGPFKKDGKATTESNAAFDASLQQRNPAWGYRYEPHPCHVLEGYATGSHGLDAQSHANMVLQGHCRCLCCCRGPSSTAAFRGAPLPVPRSRISSWLANLAMLNGSARLFCLWSCCSHCTMSATGTGDRAHERRHVQTEMPANNFYLAFQKPAL